MINGVLYHVAIVVTDSEIRCYRNGKIGHTASLDGPLTPIIPWRRADHFAIGAKLSASKDQNEYGKLSQFFQGDIRSLRLSKSERYTAGVPRAELHADADTIALYDFSQGSGDVLKDVSGNGHDGKIFGATWIDGEGQPVNAEPMP
jgi:hypothetical protein